MSLSSPLPFRYGVNDLAIAQVNPEVINEEGTLKLGKRHFSHQLAFHASRAYNAISGNYFEPKNATKEMSAEGGTFE